MKIINLTLLYIIVGLFGLNTIESIEITHDKNKNIIGLGLVDLKGLDENELNNIEEVISKIKKFRLNPIKSDDSMKKNRISFKKSSDDISYNINNESHFKSNFTSHDTSHDIVNNTGNANYSDNISINTKVNETSKNDLAKNKPVIKSHENNEFLSSEKLMDLNAIRDKINNIMKEIDNFNSEINSKNKEKSTNNEKLNDLSNKLSLYEKNANNTSKELEMKFNAIKDQNLRVKELEMKENERKNSLLSKQVLDKNMEYNTFYDQIKMQITREQDIREEVKDNLKNLKVTEAKLNELIKDIELNYVNKLDNMNTRLTEIDKLNRDLKRKILILEEQNQKEKVGRELVSIGVDITSNNTASTNSNNNTNTNKNSNNLRDINSNGSFRKNQQYNYDKYFDYKQTFPKCINKNNCRDCLEDPGCVWCGNYCTPGNKAGAYDGSCNKFSYSFCKNEDCFGLFTCEECINNDKCGWCQNTKRCFEGSANNPIGSICLGSYFHKYKQGKCIS